MGTTVGSTGQTGSSSSTDSSTNDINAFKTLDLNEFIKVLVAELQNQDPMNPMSNSELVQQVAQIRSIEANDRLTDSLDSVSLGQSLATAGNMIGKIIRGLDDSGTRVVGSVDRVTIEKGVAKLHVNDSIVTLSNVTELLPEGTDLQSLVEAEGQ